MEGHTRGIKYFDDRDYVCQHILRNAHTAYEWITLSLRNTWIVLHRPGLATTRYLSKIDMRAVCRRMSALPTFASGLWGHVCHINPQVIPSGAGWTHHVTLTNGNLFGNKLLQYWCSAEELRTKWVAICALLVTLILWVSFPWGLLKAKMRNVSDIYLWEVSASA